MWGDIDLCNLTVCDVRSIQVSVEGSIRSVFGLFSENFGQERLDSLGINSHSSIPCLKIGLICYMALVFCYILIVRIVRSGILKEKNLIVSLFVVILIQASLLTMTIPKHLTMSAERLRVLLRDSERHKVKVTLVLFLS